jgi:hypothetical protein
MKPNKKRPAAEIIFSVEESPEGGFEAHALGHSIFTQAETVAELRAMVQASSRLKHREQSSVLATLRLILGAGVTPAAPRAAVLHLLHA